MIINCYCHIDIVPTHVPRNTRTTNHHLRSVFRSPLNCAFEVNSHLVLWNREGSPLVSFVLSPGWHNKAINNTRAWTRLIFMGGSRRDHHIRIWRWFGHWTALILSSDSCSNHRPPPRPPPLSGAPICDFINKSFLETKYVKSSVIETIPTNFWHFSKRRWDSSKLAFPWVINNLRFQLCR